MSSTFCASIALLAEDGCGFGERQRRRGHQRALIGGEHLMNAVAKLMGERHHVARLAHIVHHHIGVDRRHGRVREGAGRLAGACRRVDPVAIKEAASDLGHLRIEPLIGGEDRAARVLP
jgi:hypothetical protein